MWCSYLEWCDVHDIMESNEFSLKVLYKDWKRMLWKKTLLKDTRMVDSSFNNYRGQKILQYQVLWHM